jgi:hypothetical protein
VNGIEPQYVCPPKPTHPGMTIDGSSIGPMDHCVA